MRGIIWNLRGFDQRDRRRQLIQYICDQCLDFVGLQETIRATFSQIELDSFAGALTFHWEWVPANGHSGGILVGVNKDTFDVISFSRGEFFLAVDLIQHNNNF